MANRDYQHSRPLEVHWWSEYEEAAKFGDEVYDAFLNNQFNENKRIQKKHLKLVLLDLYVAWLNDTDLNIAIHMKTNDSSDAAADELWLKLKEVSGHITLLNNN